MPPRKWILLAVIALAALALSFVPGCKVYKYLVIDGAANAKIVVPRFNAGQPDPCGAVDRDWKQVCLAAVELQDAVRGMTAADVVLPIEDDDAASPAAASFEIHLGGTHCRDEAGADLPFDELTDEEAFFIRTIDTAAGPACTEGTKFFISGKRFDDIVFYRNHGHGTRYGVYAFLEEMGVRWYLPGPLGKVSPSGLTDVEIADLNVVQVPDYVNRELSGPFDADVEWSRRNRLHNGGYVRWQFYHNVNLLLQGQVGDASAYYPDVWVHPENASGAPIPTAAPYIDPAGSTPQNSQWQPTLDPDTYDTVEHVAQRLHWYTANNAYEAISMGLMDNRDYHAPDDLPKHRFQFTEAERDAFGVPYDDVNRNLWRFTARVVERWLELGDHDNQWVGSLAYNYTNSPPPSSVDLPRNLIVHVGGDRTTTWLDLDSGGVGDVDRDYMVSWVQRVENGARIAVGEKYYGAEMFVPRLAPDVVRESLRWAHEDLPAAAGRAGEVFVEGFRAESYPIWLFDGPRYYVAARSLWDVNAGEDPMADFVNGLFGDAAGPMGEYFGLLETAWTSFPDDFPELWEYHTTRPQRIDRGDYFEMVPFPANIINGRDDPGLLAIYRPYAAALAARIDSAKAVYSGITPKPIEYYRVLAFERGFAFLNALIDYQETLAAIEDAEAPSSYNEAYAILEAARELDGDWDAVHAAYDAMCDPPAAGLPDGVDDDELGEPRWGYTTYRNHFRQYLPTDAGGLRIAQTIDWFGANGHGALQSELQSIYNGIWNAAAAASRVPREFDR